MRVIVPVTPTMVSSTVAEPDTGEVVWDGVTSFALYDQVISTTYHKKYESLQDNNLNKPLPVPPETQTDWWIEVGATNKYACLDLARNTQTVSASTLTVVVTPGERINSIALMGMEADRVVAEMETGAVVVWSLDEDLQLRRVDNGYDYCFKPFDLQPSVVRFDLPPFFESQITITLTRAVGDVKLGSIVLGTYAYLGKTQPKAVNDATNYSEITRDIYGTATLVPRRTLPKTQQVLNAPKAIVNDILDVREVLNAVPAVWSGLDDSDDHEYFESVLILGIYKQLSINLAFYDHAEVTLELEEI